MSHSRQSKHGTTAARQSRGGDFLRSPVAIIGLGAVAAGLLWGLARLAIRPPSGRSTATANTRVGGGFSPTISKHDMADSYLPAYRIGIGQRSWNCVCRCHILRVWIANLAVMAVMVVVLVVVLVVLVVV